jgi:hypothetical protein
MPYRLDESTGLIDYDAMEKAAALFRPKLIVAGGWGPGPGRRRGGRRGLAACRGWVRAGFGMGAGLGSRPAARPRLPAGRSMSSAPRAPAHSSPNCVWPFVSPSPRRQRVHAPLRLPPHARARRQVQGAGGRGAAAAVERPRLPCSKGTVGPSNGASSAHLHHPGSPRPPKQPQAWLLADMAHISGLVAAGLVPSPFEYAGARGRFDRGRLTSVRPPL